MTRFTSGILDFNYSLGELILVRVTAVNEKGSSESPSPVSTGSATAKVVPAQMPSSSITRGESTSEYQVHVSWTSMVTDEETGGAPIISYNLQYDQGTDGASWMDLVGSPSNYLLNEFIVTENIVAGEAYKFRIRARNVYGWQADYSDPAAEVAASEAPSQMHTLVTSYDAGVDVTAVKIEWVEPYDNSEPIIDYEVLIRQSDGLTFTEETTHCNAQEDPPKSQRYCFIPLTVLRASPYNLEFEDKVVAKARARNVFGYGHYSEPNLLGAAIQVEPFTVEEPVLDIASSSLTQIKLDWPELQGDNTGQSPITSYNLQWDANTNGVTWTDLKGEEGSLDTATTFTQGGLAPGQLYQFRVKARNVHGWSDEYSPAVTFQAAERPSQPAAVATELSNLSVRISWF